MKRHVCACLAGLFAAQCLSRAAWAQDTAGGSQVSAGDSLGRDDRIAELQRQVKALTREVQELRASQHEPWLTAQRAEEVRAIVHDVLADADVRSSLLQDNIQAGYDGGFFIRSADGNYQLELSGFLQVRYLYNHQNGDDVDETRYGFDLRRTRLAFRGHVVDPGWRYALQLSDAAGIYGVSDAYIERDFGNGWAVRAGQFKGPFLHETLMSAKRQLASDRSQIERAFGLNRVQGAMAMYEGGALRTSVSINDGGMTANTPALLEDTEFAATARAELLLSGSWRTLRDFTSMRGSDPAAAFGAAVHVEREESGTSTTNDETETISVTGDLQLEFGGANAFAAVVWRQLDSDIMEADQLGVVIQGGVMLSDDWEVFARYEFGDADMTGVEDLSLFTVGTNWYIVDHDVKWTNELGFALDEVSDYWSSSTRGWRADEAGEDGQIVFRSQFQLVF